ncbi:RHS repeat domain-containing protein [Emticicia sp. TH156]|uniref:RHS repeat domain-containing protein n=1 Tax=Emticicia sp. TH156 TaxID=2067454 RepID=UPI001303FD4F|nr:RHS repeat-associated core domain-containing protein [Emticicia sp. TH156]
MIRLGARGYNPTIGRFDRVDPVVAEQEEYSTYQYGWNNPVLRSDPNGDCPVCFVIFAGLFFASQPASAPSGGKKAKQEIAAYKQAYNDMGSDVVSAIMPVGKSKAVGQALYATVKKEVKQEIKEQGQKVVEKTMAEKTPKDFQEGFQKLSKVEKSKTAEKVGEKFTKKTEVRPGRGPGQSRAEYVTYKNEDGKTVKTYKDSYDRGNQFQGRKPLRGGPEGRPQ